LGIVDDVVMYERRGVDELHHGGVQNREIPCVACQARRHEQHGGPDALAAAVLDVSPDFRDQIDLGFDVPVELCFDLLQVFPDRVEHLDQTGV
jgi:hypothetical protein